MSYRNYNSDSLMHSYSFVQSETYVDLIFLYVVEMD